MTFAPSHFGEGLLARLAAVWVLCSTWCCASLAQPDSPRALLHTATSWAYQLQNVELSALQASGYDVIVIDLEDDRRAPWQPRDIHAVRQRTGKPRVLLAYISIGEAESYRSYWKPSWSRQPPVWLGEENPQWRGNYPVRYWHSGWQEILFGFGGVIDQAIGAGFDGVYLDRVDVYTEWGPTGQGEAQLAQSERAMVELVRRIADHAQKQRARPDFLIVPQNAPLLCAYSDYVSAIDAVALEDLFYHRRRSRDGWKRKRSYTDFVLERLRPLQKASKPIFVVDYLPTGQVRRRYPSVAARYGLVPYGAPSRELNRLP